MSKLSLTRAGLAHNWPADYKLPKYDIGAMVESTTKEPTWLHIGAGNIFRIFVAGLQQDLLNAGHTNKGIIVYESYDEGIIPASFTPYDNLTLAVTLNGDGTVGKEVIASIADAFATDLVRLCEIIAAPSLQMISLTITEKGYHADPTTTCASPKNAKTAMEQVAAGLLARFEAGAPPLALVTMDNFAENGTKVSQAMDTIAAVWQVDGFQEYVKTMAYPWTMIDKITPSPSSAVAELLAKDGYAGSEITQTPKHTTVASFVNAEAPQYLVMEDSFPNGRPPLEKAVGKGVFFTDRETVRKADQMKVCACLNPLHTVLGVCGSLLGYATIAACMQDKRLVNFIRASAKEAMPTVSNPGIINPEEFLNEVISQRFPNPFIPDTPERINIDASQKIPVRFGVTLVTRKKVGLDTSALEAIPHFAAMWLRYRMGKDDAGNEMPLSPDPRMPETVRPISCLSFGETADLSGILSDVSIFGVDLYEAGLGKKTEEIFAQLSEKPGAVSQLLTRWYG